MDKKIHTVRSVKTDDTYLYLTVDGQSYQIPWGDCSSKLAQATPLEREYVEISPSGYGLHWRLIDEDLAITPLLQRTNNLADEHIEKEHLPSW
jgi:hypothetical protein